MNDKNLDLLNVLMYVSVEGRNFQIITISRVLFSCLKGVWYCNIKEVSVILGIIHSYFLLVHVTYSLINTHVFSIIDVNHVSQ